MMTERTTGPIKRAGAYYSGMFVGTKGVGFPAEALFQESKPIFEVILQNDPGSANNMLVGNEFGQYVIVVPGQSITIPIDNLNKVYAVTAEGNSATANWIAMT